MEINCALFFSSLDKSAVRFKLFLKYGSVEMLLWSWLLRRICCRSAAGFAKNRLHESAVFLVCSKAAALMISTGLSNTIL